MDIGTPRELETTFLDAKSRAEAESEPVFVPCRPFCDDRGWSLMNLLTDVMSPSGQVNFSMQFPGVVKAWHRHQRQTDFWLCLEGHLKAGIYDEAGGRAWQLVMGRMRPGVLIIPPTLWHGASTVGPEPAGLLYYVTHAYDPAAPDEERRAWDSVPEFPWGVQHR